jgi:alpha-beta hydrolase superfamily lysophospholipase
MRRAELLSFLATDKVKLPGLLFEPDQPTKKVAVWLHGMGDSGVFYKATLINSLATGVNARGITLLAFNNRGAHDSKSLSIVDEQLSEEDRHYQGGTHYEKIADCVYDIDGAVALLKDRGYSELYLLGHSTGANKICAYHERVKHNPFIKYVLAGPGDDVGTSFNSLGAKRFWQALKYAAKATDAGKGSQAMPKYTGMAPFSAQSTWDMLNPDGSYNTFPFYEATTERLGKKRLFDEYQKINLPTLVIFGEEDEYAYTAGNAAKALGLFMKYTSNAMLKQTDFALVPAADHSFHGAEEVFTKQVADWLAYG